MKANYIKGLLLLNLVATASLAWLYLTPKAEPDFSDQILTVRGIVVIDSSGVERAILGAPLPGPTYHGYRSYRGDYGQIAGLMLYDSEGQERGGYVTDDSYGNVFLTLDSKTQQNALFVGDPFGGAAMLMWGRNGNRISLQAGDEDVKLDVTKNRKKLSITTHEKE